MQSDDPELMPRRSTYGSAGYDFYAAEDVEIGPDRWTKFSTGIRFDGSERPQTVAVINGVPTLLRPEMWFMQILPRSSYGIKYKFRLSMTMAIIDKDYRNDIMIEATSEIPFTIRKGERYAQGIIIPYCTFTDEIHPAASRTGGMGSTGE